MNAIRCVEYKSRLPGCRAMIHRSMQEYWHGDWRPIIGSSNHIRRLDKKGSKWVGYKGTTAHGFRDWEVQEVILDSVPEQFRNPVRI